ncbi:Atrial natriuretic peptide receptor 1 [Eumeta japonica]|uniref:Atrial natriuretic peptide receptor 1 n=1 Tax=Eumeta variegata TaxID=151549 RepID=A0A4C1Y216_EUMVA|nr:Atrial natriuretic peptide receptor 1 [Eumeta japonica]
MTPSGLRVSIGSGDDRPPSEGELAAPVGVLSRMHRLRNLRNGSAPQTLFNDKGKYPTLTRMSYCQCRLPHVFASVFARFGWSHVALLLDKSDLFSLTVGKSLEWGLRRGGYLKAVRELDGNERESCESLLKDVSMYARVVILCVRAPLVREFLLAAHALGMTRGDWAFLDVEIFQNPLLHLVHRRNIYSFKIPNAVRFSITIPVLLSTAICPTFDSERGLASDIVPGLDLSSAVIEVAKLGWEAEESQNEIRERTEAKTDYRTGVKVGFGIELNRKKTGMGIALTKYFTSRLCAAAVSLVLGRIGRWSGREIARSALSFARSAQMERDNDSCFFGGYWGETGWAAGDGRDTAARAAYEALLRVSLKLPTGDRFDEFADRVRARAKQHYNYTFSDGEELAFTIHLYRTSCKRTPRLSRNKHLPPLINIHSSEEASTLNRPFAITSTLYKLSLKPSHSVLVRTYAMEVLFTPLQVNFFIGAFYDGVYLLGMSLNETLTEGGDIRDGRAITNRMWGRDFHGITGHVRIESSGDRDADYAILDLDPVTGKFEVVAFYHGVNTSYQPIDGKAIHWPGGRRAPPPDKPRCGFLGNDPKCQGELGSAPSNAASAPETFITAKTPGMTSNCTLETQAVIIYCFIGLGIFLTLATTAACVAYKQARLSAKLNNMAWRVRPEEVLIEAGQPLGANAGLHNVNEVLKHSFGWSARSNAASPAGAGVKARPAALTAFTVGLYKGNKVAVKKIPRKKLDVNTKLLMEIKQVFNGERQEEHL